MPRNAAGPESLSLYWLARIVCAIADMPNAPANALYEGLQLVPFQGAQLLAAAQDAGFVDAAAGGWSLTDAGRRLADHARRAYEHAVRLEIGTATRSFTDFLPSGSENL